MAVIVAVMGESGTGKSTSLRNFQKGEASVINVSKKPLPFRNTLSVFKTDNYQEVQAMIKRAQAKSVVIDDAQYLMAFEYMHRAKEKGFEKFTDIGANFFNLTQTATALPDDKIIYFLFHIHQAILQKMLFLVQIYMKKKIKVQVHLVMVYMVYIHTYY